ncbi:MAG: leucine-rich repeat domain-containing protein, partial [Oscillospiraceae bacterium]|nr:leucine-rich repeat domain-containing protein [Oscillospiraceae bacterium]
MKPNTKKLLAIVAAFALCASNGPIFAGTVTASASAPEATEVETSFDSTEMDSIVESGQCGENAFYKLYANGVLTIFGEGDMYSYSADNTPFKENLSIKQAVIENGITGIGSFAFYKCANMESISISDSVTKVEGYAFVQTGLTSCDIPDSVTYLGEGVFIRCSGLKSISIGNGVTAFEGLMKDIIFLDCTALEDVVINSVETIPDTLFVGNFNNLKSVTLGTGVKHIGYCSFNGCKSLESVTILGDLESIGSEAFANCSALETIHIPDTVKSVGNFAFLNTSAMKSVYLYTDPDELNWNSPYADFNTETICYVPAKYYFAYVDNHGTEVSDFYMKAKVTFRPIEAVPEAELTATYNSAVEEVALTDYVDVPAENISFVLTENSELPAGLTMNENFVISGTPKTAGNFTTTFDIYLHDYDSDIETPEIPLDDFDMTTDSSEDALYIGTLTLTSHIAKAEPEMHIKLKKSKVTSKDILSQDDFTVNSNVEGSVIWDNLGNALTEGETKLNWTFIPDDSEHYETVSGEIVVNVESPEEEPQAFEAKRTFSVAGGIQYGVTYDLSNYDFEHITGVSVKFKGQTDSTTRGSIVLGNWVSSTVLSSDTVSEDGTVNISFDQYALTSPVNTLTINDWYHTSETLGEIESVTFYYIEDEKVSVPENAVVLDNINNANQFDLSAYDYKNIKAITMVFDGIIYGGNGALFTGQYNNIAYHFDMNRTDSYTKTIEVNGNVTSTLNFYNYWNLANLDYIVLGYADSVNPTEATEPSTEATEPSTEATEPSTEATEPSTEA